MKKTVSIMLLLLGLFTLAACGGDDEDEVTLPTFNRIEVEERSPVEGSDLFAFVKEKQETIRVEVFINNPSNLSINAITIAGITYRTPRFEEGSTNSRIIIEHTVGQIPGETINAVQEIEYIHEVTRTLQVTENNEYKFFVLKSIPSASFNRVTPSTNAVEVEINLTDIDSVLVNGRLEILHADEVIDSISVNRGVQTRRFDDLLTNQNYTMRVVGDYNLNDGAGLIEDYVFSVDRAVTTLESLSPSVSVSNQAVSETTFSFDYAVTDLDNVLEDEGLLANLYLGAELIESLSLSVEQGTLIFEGLLNDNVYTLEIVADYDLRDGQGVRESVLMHTEDFSTPEREVPEISLSQITVTDTSLGFRVNTTALLGLADFETIRVRLTDVATDTVFVESALIDDNLYYEVIDLLANQTIRVEISAMVDLSDGQGEREEVVYSNTFTTTANQAPSATVSIVSFTQTSIAFQTQVTDASNVLQSEGIRAELYEDRGNGVVKIAEKRLPSSSGAYAFDIEPTSDATYTIKLFALYDLRDGEGEREKDLEATYSKRPTQAKTPVLESLTLEATRQTMSIHYAVLDNDETITELILRVNGEDYVVDTLSGTLVVEDLHSDTNYTVELIASYTVTTPQSRVLGTSEARTQAYDAPSLVLEGLMPSREGITFDMMINDPFSFLNVESIAVYRGNTQVASTMDGSQRSFDGLRSNTEYRLIATYSYDLLNNQGTRTQTVEVIFRTEAKTAASVSVSEIVEDKGSLSFMIYVNDKDATIVDQEVSVYLLQNGTVVDSILTAINETVTFTNLENSQQYTVRIVADVDKNEGTVLTDQTLYEVLLETMDLSPAIGLTDTTLLKERIDLRLSYDDIYDIVDLDSLRLGLYNQSDERVGSLRRLDNSLGISIFNLWSNYTYTVRVYGDIDYNDGRGLLEGEMLFEETLTTEAYNFPPINLEDLTINVADETLSISVVMGEDTDDVYSAIRLVLYEVDDAGFTENAMFTIDKNAIEESYTFANFDPTTEYRIRVYADYDLHDSFGLRENQLLGEVSPMYAEKN